MYSVVIQTGLSQLRRLTWHKPDMSEIYSSIAFEKSSHLLY